jgi:ABC-2 type transport system permease protein
VKRQLRVLMAFVVRDATMAISYRLEFLLQLATVFFYITALYFLSTIIGQNDALDPYGGYLPFAAIGMAVASYFQVGFDSFSKAIHREQLQGTLEALLVFASLGVLSASFLMVWKRGDPVGLLMGGLMTLFGGVFYPVSAMPEWLQRISYVLPITYGLDGIRGVLLRGAGVSEVWPQIVVLLGFVAVLTPLAMYCFGWAVHRAQRDGTLLHF